MHLLNLTPKGAADPVSVQVDHAIDGASKVVTMLATGVAAGTQAAVKSVLPHGATTLLASLAGVGAEPAANRSALAATVPKPGANALAAHPGAMLFFKEAARLNSTSRRKLRQQSRKQPSLLVMAAAASRRAKAKAQVARVDAVGSHVDILRPRKTSLARALATTALSQDRLADEQAAAEDLARQGGLDEAMTSARGAWGL